MVTSIKIKLSIFLTILLFCLPNISLAADEIIIGAPLALTGPYASDGAHAWYGIQIAMDDLNMGGGLLGKQVTAIKFDTQDFAPERVMLAADQLIGLKKVDTIHAGFAGWGQDVRAYGKYEVPTFLMDAASHAVDVWKEDPVKYSNIFQMADVEKKIAERLFHNMNGIPYDYPKKTIAIVTSDDAWGMGTADGLIAAAEANGWKIVLKEAVPYGTTEWGPIMTKIRSLKPGWIHFEVMGVAEPATFIRQFRKKPTQTLVNLGFGFSIPDLASNLGKLTNGVMGQAPSIPDPPPTPEFAAWADRYEKKFGNRPDAGITYQTYKGVMVWADAVKAVGNHKDYAAINTYLQKNKFKTLLGRYIHFNEEQTVPVEFDPIGLLQGQSGVVKTISIEPGVILHGQKFMLPPWIKK
jgi:ABC-type branched-subunit amino acid transport system substrate-binding protein